MNKVFEADDRLEEIHKEAVPSEKKSIKVERPKK